MKQRSFPAVLIAFLLLLVCYFPVQRWLAPVVPGISGRATLDAGLTIFEIPVRLPFPIDLILAPVLFILLYSVAILTFSSGQGRWQLLAKRLGAVGRSVSVVLLCLAVGNLLSLLLSGYLPAQIREGLHSIAVNADLHLPYAGYPTVHLLGDTISLLGLIVGLVIGARIMRKKPKLRIRFRLTREQLMTPYQRMLLERRNSGAVPVLPGNPANQPAPISPAIGPTDGPANHGKELTAFPRHHPTTKMSRHHEPSHGICRNQPLLTLQPEAVNFRPLG
jgi:hypothetical protein